MIESSFFESGQSDKRSDAFESYRLEGPPSRDPRDLICLPSMLPSDILPTVKIKSEVDTDILINSFYKNLEGNAQEEAGESFQLTDTERLAVEAIFESVLEQDFSLAKDSFDVLCQSPEERVANILNGVAGVLQERLLMPDSEIRWGLSENAEGRHATISLLNQGKGYFATFSNAGVRTDVRDGSGGKFTTPEQIVQSFFSREPIKPPRPPVRLPRLPEGVLKELPAN